MGVAAEEQGPQAGSSTAFYEHEAPSIDPCNGQTAPTTIIELYYVKIDA